MLDLSKSINLFQGDCLELMKDIPDGSVDLVLTDPPYGTMRGTQLDGWDANRTAWDTVIDSKLMWHEINRVLRVNGCCILFSQDPYTTELVANGHDNVPFSYRLTWIKDHFANALIAKKAPVNYTEDICVFFKKHDCLGLHPLRLYFKKVMDYIGLNLPQINKKLGQRKAEHSFYVTPKSAVIGEIGGRADHVTRVGSTQFALCTEQTYNEIVAVFGIDKMQGFKPYNDLVAVNRAFNRAFNLPDGARYKSNILEYKKDYSGYHPTQKPVALLEDLIKTYSNESDTVLDFTAGSMSTAIACINTNRKCIMIEKDEHYYNVGRDRVINALQDKGIENLAATIA